LQNAYLNDSLFFMTTIATDGQFMAADTDLFTGYVHSTSMRKLVYSHKTGFWYGLAGLIAELKPFVEWHENGERGRSPLSEESCVLVLRETAWFYYRRSAGVDIGLPAAIGSGKEFAMGAMLAGADPVKAVYIACQLDSDSGGDICCVKPGSSALVVKRAEQLKGAA
jgi:hypothetical protein